VIYKEINRLIAWHGHCCHGKKERQRTISAASYAGHRDLKRIHNNSDAFTFVELLIAIVIFGILAGLGAPRLSTMIPKRRLNGAAQKIAWDLQAARMVAIKQKYNVSVTFVNDVDYKIWQDRDHDNVEDADEVTMKSIRDAYRGVHIASTQSPTFHPLGTVSNTPDAGQPITLSNASGSKTIVVSIAGRVKLSS
jgi:prepilin-type N-terminal cleavage/methylation domain-containing protein